MKFAKKEFSFYWKIIQIPVYILVLWSLAGLFTAKYALDSYLKVFGSPWAAAIGIAVYAIVGYLAVADHKFNIKLAAWAGALTGIISAFIGAIIGIILLTWVPEITENAVQQAIEQGAPEEIIRGFMTIGAYVQLVLGPLFSGLLAAGVAAIGGLIAKKVEGK
ncbi:MAG: hypothetical protein KKG59_06610 [Nanoarchaeota archaeon]|nr:hypothetical protein [Nanoarchaeota archaeon]